MISVWALSPALDVTYDLGTLVRGSINRPTRTTTVAGGKALNMARVARRLGADVHVTAALGGCTGERVRRLLAAEGVAVTVVKLAAETRTCLALVEDGGGATSTDVYEPATPVDAGEWKRFAVAVREVPQARWITVSGSMPDGVPLGGVAELLAEARSGGSRVAVDTSGAALSVLAGQSDLVKVNRAEVEELVGHGVADAAAACLALQERFGVDAVVTDGVRGGAALLAGQSVLFAPPQTVGRYPAGSGDSFFGGLMSGLDRDLPLSAALELARGAAERNAHTPGQGLLAPALT